MPVHGLDLNLNPELFIWARNFIGLGRDEAAKKAGMSSLDLQFIEEGGEGVNYSTLAKLAKVYDQPELVFFLKTPPSGKDFPSEFRGLSLPNAEDWSYELRTEYRRVIRQRKRLIDIFDEEDEDERPHFSPLLHVSSSDSIESLGLRIRSWLGFDSLEEKPSDGYGYFNSWSKLVEGKGVLVTQVQGIAVSEMRGFCIVGSPYPAIAINVKDSIYARIFTLMHELVHILLGQDAVDSESYQSRGIDRTLERFCNAVASSILLPDHLIAPILESLGDSPASRMGRGDVVKIGHSLGVSGEALLLRLVTLGAATWDDHWHYRDQVNQEEREENDKADVNGGDYYRNHMRWKGRLYLTTIVDALERDLISAPDFTRFTDIKLKNLPSLKEKLGVG